MRYLGSLMAVVVGLVLTVAVGLYADRAHEDMHERNLVVSSGLERMVRLNQAMGSLLQAAVHDKNGLRASRYDTLHQELKATMALVVKATQDLSLASEITALVADHEKLRQVETRALTQIQQGQWQAARDILLDERFELFRRAYEIKSEKAVGVLTGELAAMTARLDGTRHTVLAALVGVMLLIMWIGAALTRRLRQEQAQQERLQSEIRRANEELEAKVRERTVELEIANGKLQALSRTDALTGLSNRGHFDVMWQTEWQRALRAGDHLAMILVDVDHFKAFNDCLGHPAGDGCLQRMGDILAAVRNRPGDFTARYGGEEFVVILPGCDTPSAQRKAEGLRVAMMAAAIAHPASPTAPVVTISAGVASCIPQADQDPAHVLQLADQALYQAKSQGRNRVVVS